MRPPRPRWPRRFLETNDGILSAWRAWRGSFIKSLPVSSQYRHCERGRPMSNRLIIVSRGNGLTLLRNKYNDERESRRPVHEAKSDMSTPETPSPEQLETFANQYSGRDYTIEIVCPEF